MQLKNLHISESTKVNMFIDAFNLETFVIEKNLSKDNLLRLVDILKTKNYVNIVENAYSYNNPLDRCYKADSTDYISFELGKFAMYCFTVNHTNVKSVYQGVRDGNLKLAVAFFRWVRLIMSNTIPSDIALLTCTRVLTDSFYLDNTLGKYLTTDLKHKIENLHEIVENTNEPLFYKIGPLILDIIIPIIDIIENQLGLVNDFEKANFSLVN